MVEFGYKLVHHGVKRLNSSIPTNCTLKWRVGGKLDRKQRNEDFGDFIVAGLCALQDAD